MLFPQLRPSFGLLISGESASRRLQQLYSVFRSAFTRIKLTEYDLALTHTILCTVGHGLPRGPSRYRSYLQATVSKNDYPFCHFVLCACHTAWLLKGSHTVGTSTPWFDVGMFFTRTGVKPWNVACKPGQASWTDSMGRTRMWLVP